MAGKSIMNKRKSTKSTSKSEAPKRKGSKLRGAVKIAMAAKILGRKGKGIRGRSKK